MVPEPLVSSAFPVKLSSWSNLSSTHPSAMTLALSGLPGFKTTANLLLLFLSCMADQLSIVLSIVCELFSNKFFLPLPFFPFLNLGQRLYQTSELISWSSHWVTGIQFHSLISIQTKQTNKQTHTYFFGIVTHWQALTDIKPLTCLICISGLDMLFLVVLNKPCVCEAVILLLALLQDLQSSSNSPNPTQPKKHPSTRQLAQLGHFHAKIFHITSYPFSCVQTFNVLTVV